MAMQNFLRAAARRVIAVFRAAELPVPIETHFADAMFIVIAEVLLYCAGRRFPLRHAAKAVILPTRAFQSSL
ncbi:hypothetical protein EGK14_18175 [Erwinia sp. 198]|nr:hypothetical protein EGK14_18175 [Erwinia sp. 198]